MHFPLPEATVLTDGIYSAHTLCVRRAAGKLMALQLNSAWQCHSASHTRLAKPVEIPCLCCNAHEAGNFAVAHTRLVAI